MGPKQLTSVTIALVVSYGNHVAVEANTGRRHNILEGDVGGVGLVV